MKNLRFKANTFHLYKYYLFLAGLEFGLATHLLEHEADLRYIQTLLGKSSRETTEIYTHVTKKGFENLKSPFDALEFEKSNLSDV